MKQMHGVMRVQAGGAMTFVTEDGLDVWIGTITEHEPQSQPVYVDTGVLRSEAELASGRARVFLLAAAQEIDRLRGRPHQHAVSEGTHDDCPCAGDDLCVECLSQGD